MRARGYRAGAPAGVEYRDPMGQTGRAASGAGSDPATRQLAVLTAVAGAVGLLLIAFWVPTEQQGVIQRIFYIHVPAAWAAYTAFGIVALSSVLYLWKRTPAWDLRAHAAAEAGLVFTVVNLVTGMLWGRQQWNAFWSWDPRLTSTFVMALVYAGYLAFRAMATDREGGARVGAVIGILGVVEIPIIHLSVVLWRSLHPGPTVTRLDLPWEMLVVLLYMTAVALGLLAVMVRMRLGVGWAQERLLAAELQDREPVG